MSSSGEESPGSSWLEENGPRELELLFRAIVYHPSIPILMTDDAGKSRDASVGVSKLLGLPLEKIIGRHVDEFGQPGSKPPLSQLWRALRKSGEQEGTVRLAGADGIPRNVAYVAKANVLPMRHLLVLHDQTRAEQADAVGAVDKDPLWG